jgi:2'-5' RNA ligase
LPAAPLILTLRFDTASFARLDALRRAHFPPERNHIPAHLTLFHALPGEAEEEIAVHLQRICTGTPVQALRVARPRSLGRGVALDVEAPTLAVLRAELARHWAAWLTPQDAQAWRPHVTIQNKVSPGSARALLDAMVPGFEAWAARGEGLLLWRYRGGPWEAAAEIPFTG